MGAFVYKTMTAPRTNASHDQNRIPTLLGVSTADGTTPVPVEVDPSTGGMIISGSISTSSVGLFTLSYDYIAVAYPDAVTEVYTTYAGGSGGTLRETVTIVYTDSTKAAIDHAART